MVTQKVVHSHDSTNLFRIQEGRKKDGLQNPSFLLHSDRLAAVHFLRVQRVKGSSRLVKRERSGPAAGLCGTEVAPLTSAADTLAHSRPENMALNQSGKAAKEKNVPLLEAAQGEDGTVKTVYHFRLVADAGTVVGTSGADDVRITGKADLPAGLQ